MTLSATGGASTSPVVFTSNSPLICTTGGTNGATVSFVQPGTCDITASQAGDGNYAAASDATGSFTIGQAAQVISFAPPATQPFASGGTLGLTATGGGSTNPVVFNSETPSVCQTSGTKGETLTIMSPGNCDVTATQAGDDTFADADPVKQTIVIETQPVDTQSDGKPLVVVMSGPLYHPGTALLSYTGGAQDGVVTFNVISGPCTVSQQNGSTSTISSTGVGQCVVEASMEPGITSLAVPPEPVTITSEPLTIVINSSEAVSQATQMVEDSLKQNARIMLDYNPTSDRLAAGRSGGGTYGALAPQGTSAEGSVAFSTSLQQITQAQGKGDKQGLAVNASADQAGGGMIQPTSASPSRENAPLDPYARAAGTFDIWIDGRFFWYDGSGDDGAHSNGFLGEGGVDYLLSDNLLVGVSLRYDDGKSDSSGSDGSLDTVGWMAGPYAVLALGDTLQIDAKVMWGMSSNDISVDANGTSFDGNYDTTRALVDGGIRGLIQLDRLTIEPSARASYYSESSDSFRLDNDGGDVSGQDYEVFRLAFDPRLSYSKMTEEGTAIGPFMRPALVAEWNNAADGDSGWDVYGTFEAGLNVATERFALSASVQASGIGANDGMSYIAGANLNIPLW